MDPDVREQWSESLLGGWPVLAAQGEGLFRLLLQKMLANRGHRFGLLRNLSKGSKVSPIGDSRICLIDVHGRR